MTFLNLQKLSSNWRVQGWERSDWRSEEFQLHTRLSGLEHWYWEKESPQHLAVKKTGDSVHPSEMED